MMARHRAKGLTDRQKKILEALERFQDQNGYPPSIRELCEKTSISSTSVVNYYLNQLEDSGYIERDGRVSRGIRLVRPLSETAAAVTGSLKQSAHRVAEAVEELLHIPKVGVIVAGLPAPMPASDFSYYDAESMVDVARSLLPTRERDVDKLYALEVRGDSMIDAMVNDGDIVIMKPAQEALNGEMVAVFLTEKDETTLKYFYKEGGRVRLQPANPTMGPIYVEDPSKLRIQGKVVMVIRQVGGLPS
jgi:repressor LexA